MSCCTPAGYGTVFAANAARRDARRFRRRGLHGSARGLIAEHRLEGRIEPRIGDFAATAAEQAIADAVVLHRVICCHPDADGLTRDTCDHARGRIGITAPRRAWWMRAPFAAMNAWFRLRRTDFAVYVHPPVRILAIADAGGFRPSQHHRGALCESFILERTARP